jgi:TIR domain/Pentapeptide repeats (8 copies)
MANPEHLAILKEGVGAWNNWRRTNPSVIPCLDGADLSNKDSSKALFGKANLSLANLKRADLSWADLNGASLSQADLSEAECIGTEFQGALSDGAIFRSVYLFGAVFSAGWHLDLDGETILFFEGPELSRADFTNSQMGHCVFANTNLSDVIGLDTVKHLDSSSIDIATLYATKGGIPEVFLRGCGIPDSLITFQRSLKSSPSDYYSCFISHSTNDKDFADKLQADLQFNGVRCWFAPHDIRGGKKIHDQIDQAIRVYDRLLLILSDHSMASEWVKTEIANARQREVREKRQMLFPISLVPYEQNAEWKAFDADTGKDSAREIREYFIPDFSDWKNHDSYERAFQRLLKDLKAEGSSTS